MFVLIFGIYYIIMKSKFTTRLTELITESGKTQNSICRELRIPKQKLSNWKTGYTEPCIEDIIMLAIYFDVSTDYLFGIVDETGARILQ